MIAAFLLKPEAVQALGWTLVHFVWEGAALALLLYMFFAFTRNARVRYAAAVITLVLMTLSPAVTFAVLHARPEAVPDASSANQVIGSLRVAAELAMGHSAMATPDLPSVDWLLWLVWAWVAGVLVFSVRALGGWLVLERLHRNTREPVTDELLARCLRVQRRLALTQPVRYFRSHLVDAPAVMGWFRPVVLVPITAITGLPPQQLEAVIAHELAHIKRFDCFINLFQIAVETVLFYHPAVWWVSKCIRSERENCCDDIAVAVCGNAGDYARALTAMESWRSLPSLVLAANSGSLRSRVGRLLGVETITRSIPRGGLAAVGVLCAAGALFATTNTNYIFNQEPVADSEIAENVQLPDAPKPPAAPAIADAYADSCVRSARAARWGRIARLNPAPIVVAEAAAYPMPPEPPQAAPAAPPSANQPSGESYIAGLRAAGLKDLTVNQIIALKIQGVTPDYIREIRATGLNPDAHALIALRVQGVTPEYIRKARADFGNNVTVHQIIAMKVQKVDPSEATEFRKLGLSELNLNQLISLRALGVTPDYVRTMQAAGFKNLTTHEIVAAKAQGITPEFVEKVRSHGFANLSLRQLIELKVANLF
jgi:beta-lactamase regulating signal transducer with metallopeptidase domain